MIDRYFSSLLHQDCLISRSVSVVLWYAVALHIMKNLAQRMVKTVRSFTAYVQEGAKAASSLTVVDVRSLVRRGALEQERTPEHIPTNQAHS